MILWHFLFLLEISGSIRLQYMNILQERAYRVLQGKFTEAELKDRIVMCWDQTANEEIKSDIKL